jgi:succinoglycan biosynthesis transport protein ExoP
MAQYEMNIRDYWLIVRRRRMTILGCVVLTMFFAFFIGRQKAPDYQATAAVKFEQSVALTGLLVEVLSYNSGDNIETQATLIKSYPILEEVARRLGRVPRTVSGEAVRESRAYSAQLDNLASKLRTSRVGGTSILEITATSGNPLEARDLANTVAEVYRDYNKANRNARVTEARKFIEGQLREVEGRVRRAEEEVWAFRDANRIISPGAESSMLLSLFTQVRGDVEKARQQRIELEQILRRLERTDAGSVSDRVYIETQNPAVTRLLATQTELLLERNNLALEVTERHPRLQAIDDRLREVRRELRREVAAQIAQLRNREEILARQEGELLQRNREVPAVELSLQRLQRDAKVNDDLLTLLKTRHQEALIKESEGIEEVTIVRPATEPGAPVGTGLANTLLVGALLGLVLGLGLAFLQETLDTSIGTIEDVESYLEVPVLGIVPHIDPRETMQRLIERRPTLAQMDPEALQSHALLITHFDPKSPVAEAYRTLRTHIQFARQDRGGKVLVVTSPTLQEGKTTTIVNLAITMAQSGQKTLLIGGNMRRPSIYRFFGIEREPGLSDILVGNARWRDCIRTVADILMGRFEMEDIMASPGLDNLHIIEAGPIPANPSELLSTSALGQFLSEVSAEYDIVLIDTPPVLPVTDSAIVAGQADGVLLVYQAGKVGRLVLKRAKAHLESTRAKVWGVVLNDVQTEVSGYTYTHYYTHYYGEETPSAREGGPLQRAWDAVRSKVGGGGSGSSASPAASRSDGSFVVAEKSSASRARRARPRRLAAGLVLLGVLGVVLVGVVAWRMGALRGATDRPIGILRERLGIGGTPPPPRSAPAGKPSPATPSRPVTPAPTSSPNALGAAIARPAAPPAPSASAPAASIPASSPSAASSADAVRPVVTSPTAPPPAAKAESARVTAPPPPMTPMPSARPETPPPSARLELPAVSAGPDAPRAEPPRTAVTPATSEPAAPAPPASRQVGAVTSPPAAAPPRAAVKRPAATAPATPRFALEFGPFAAAADAERIEKTLTQAGYQTVRFRQQSSAALYAVLIERVPGATEAQALVNALREQGLPDATVVAQDPPVVRAAEPLPLRRAVELAERLRAAGQPVRVAAQPGQTTAYTVRHGSFASRPEAEARAGELVRLGLASQVIQVR